MAKLMMRFMPVKIYSYFSFVLSAVPKLRRASSCWKYRKWCSYFENRYHHTKMIRKKRIIGQSLLPAVVFQKRKYQFSEVALVTVHCNCLTSCFMIVLGSRLWNTTNTKWIFTCLWKTTIKTLKQNAKFSQTYYQV